MVGTPSVVHGQCAVTRHHVLESRGGLYFLCWQDLAAVTKFYLENPAVRAQHAASGRRYVEREYSWDAVMERFDGAVSKLSATRLEVVQPAA